MSPEEHHGFEPPNHTQTPNALFDLLPDMAEAELKVTLAICRKTFGWHKKEEELSLSQIRELTGLSRQGVIDGISAGMRRGTIRRRPRGQSFIYRLKLVQNLDQLAAETSPKSRPELVQNLDRTSPKSRPELVQNSDTQKKGKKETKEKKETPPPPTSSSKPMPIGGGGGSIRDSAKIPTEVEAWMLAEGFSKKAAIDLRQIDLPAAQADYARRRSLGQGHGAIVNAWRDRPPTAGAAEHNPMDGPWAPADFARVRAMLGIAEDEEEAAA